jgi:F-type H+-transporting ATPase subunit a
MLNLTDFNTTINNPLEQFDIKEFIYFGGPLIGFKLSLTNLGFYLIIVTVLILGINYLVGNIKIVPSRWSLIQELLFINLLGLIFSIIGPKGQKYFPFLYCLFIYILLSNSVGLIPYSFSVTSQFSMTISLSFTIVLGCTILGLQTHRLKFFALLLPAGTPLILAPFLIIIETVSYLARFISLGLRLAANIIAGHILLKIISSMTWGIMLSSTIGFFIGIIPILFLVVFTGLEIAIAFIQSFVFVLLVASYINDVLNLHNSPLGLGRQGKVSSISLPSGKRAYSTKAKKNPTHF